MLPETFNINVFSCCPANTEKICDGPPSCLRECSVWMHGVDDGDVTSYGKNCVIIDVYIIIIPATSKKGR